LEYQTIRSTQLKPSRIGLGTWAIGGWMWGGPDDENAVAAIHRALDADVTLIDTAPAYGQGHAEEVVGKALAGRRDRVVVATKVGLEWNAGGEVTRNASAARIAKEIDDSLRRLKTDYIDIYQIHWPDPNVPMEETATAMRALYESGKIKAIGVSNFSPEQMDDFRRFAPLHTIQPPFNIFEQEAERDVLPYARAHDLFALTYGAICRGLLSGTMSQSTVFGGDDLRRTDPKFQPPRFARYLRAVARLDDLARERFGKRVIHLALRWVLDTPGVGAALWGARSPSQVDAISGAFGFSIDAQTRSDIDRIVTEEIGDPVGPEFMAPPEEARR
jgi:aryl-alcohol dehydrogenase-like predicted oxidoreductase